MAMTAKFYKLTCKICQKQPEGEICARHQKALSGEKYVIPHGRNDTPSHPWRGDNSKKWLKKKNHWIEY